MPRRWNSTRKLLTMTLTHMTIYTLRVLFLNTRRHETAFRTLPLSLCTVPTHKKRGLTTDRMSRKPLVLIHGCTQPTISLQKPC